MIQTKKSLLPDGIAKMKIQQVLEDGKKVRNNPKPVCDGSNHVKMSRNATLQSRINSALPASSMIASSEMPSFADLSAVSSKISKWFEMGGTKIESFEVFEKVVGLSGEEIMKAEANDDEIITAEAIDEEMPPLPL